ncbi:lactonase family protein [Streptomyces sp. NPDC050204]|uniref:lactonase family protein n=1 Tax=unclassified Streptomyces TaxID=2593676 RepID=UPI002DD8538A|nr:lactonase family protein [Streptomyces sp. NBC_01768]WSC26788.1 lactonase family protein [Streptomyces sp. NBC_01768]
MNHDTSRRAVLGALLAGAALSAAPAPPRAPLPAPDPAAGVGPRPRTIPRLLIGTYTSAEGGGTGIGTAGYDAATGEITAGPVIGGVADPSYLALHPSGGTVYAVDEQEQGGVTAVALSPDGGFRVLGTRATGGAGPTHLSVHPTGKWLLSANYTSGSVAVHPIGGDGSLGERTDLVAHDSPPPGPGQDGPHAHQIITTPDGGHVLAVDLGNDAVYTYRLDERRGTLDQVSRAALRPGAGPRHLTFHPGGRHAYLACEVDNTAVVCGYDPATGTLSPGAPQPTGTGPGTSYPAQFLVTGDGRFAYLANRGHNSLTRYAVEDDGAALRLLGTVPVGGDFPRQIAFSPDGKLLFAANQRSGTVTVFRVGSRDGGLTRTGASFAAPVAVCVLPYAGVRPAGNRARIDLPTAPAQVR